MEKTVEENSVSFEHKVEDMNTGDSPVPVTEPVSESEEKLDVKPDEEAKKEKATDLEDSEDVKGEEEPKEEETKNEEESVETPRVESEAPSLEKVSEEIDQFLVTLHENVEAKENKSTKLEIPSCVPLLLYLVEEKLVKYDNNEVKWGENAEEDSSFLQCVSRISKLVKHFSEYSQSHEEDKEEQQNEKDKVKGKTEFMINGIGTIQQRAMSLLEEEFRLLMEEPRNQHNKQDQKGKQQQQQHQQQVETSESESPSEVVLEYPCYAEETVTNLSKIAKVMIEGGYEMECCHVYAISRRHAIEDGMHNVLGYEKLSIDEAQRMQWEPLEREIPTWINTWKECTSVWFPAEFRLAKSVLAESVNTAASLYGNLFRGILIQLLNFAESIAMTKRAGEKLFKLLDMYESLRDVISDMEGVFLDEIFVAGEVKAEITSVKCRLGEAAVLIFCDLENSIKSESGKTPVAGGAVHPLTRYIMNYLRLACEYKDTLEEVFKEHSKIERADSTSRPRYNDDEHKRKNSNNNSNSNKDNQKENVSPFATQLMRVMELLDSNLEGKAKLYREVALSCIFMMNNGRYIVQKIKGSAEIYEVMGETWCRKRSTELRSYHKNYQVETWSKILSYLSPKGLTDNGKVQKPVLKERFKSFNAAFEEIHKTQSAWVVSDEQLQSELRVSISALVIPAYRSFLGRFSQYLDPGRQTEKYVKYQAEDVETYIDELFDGNPHGRRY